MIDTQRIHVNGQTFRADDPALQFALEGVYGSLVRPRCMCVPDGVDMYIARHGSLVAKRMPGTGCDHHPSCPSFEADYSQSGLGALMGQTVLQHEDDQVELKVDFPMSRGAARSARYGNNSEVAAVKSPTATMSMRALLHYLFEQAGFNRWYPAMKGKRTQRTLRKYLYEAAGRMTIKGTPLSQRLYIPEAYQSDEHDAIVQRRREQLAFLYRRADIEGTTGGNLALVLGEYKDSQPGNSARRVWLKHMPDMPLMIRDVAWKRIVRRFGTLLASREADASQSMRLMFFALVQAENEHLLYIELACLMLTTSNWIPIEGPQEIPLLDSLTTQQRKFLKPLRYDAPTAGQFPNALLLDTGPQPTALHIISGLTSSAEAVAKQRALGEGRSVWTWRTDAAMPMLPQATASNR